MAHYVLQRRSREPLVKLEAHIKEDLDEEVDDNEEAEASLVLGGPIDDEVSSKQKHDRHQR